MQRSKEFSVIKQICQDREQKNPTAKTLDVFIGRHAVIKSLMNDGVPQTYFVVTLDGSQSVEQFSLDNAIDCLVGIEC